MCACLLINFQKNLNSKLQLLNSSQETSKQGLHPYDVKVQRVRAEGGIIKDRVSKFSTFFNIISPKNFSLPKIGELSCVSKLLYPFILTSFLFVGIANTPSPTIHWWPATVKRCGITAYGERNQLFSPSLSCMCSHRTFPSAENCCSKKNKFSLGLFSKGNTG